MTGLLTFADVAALERRINPLKPVQGFADLLEQKLKLGTLVLNERALQAWALDVIGESTALQPGIAYNFLKHLEYSSRNPFNTSNRILQLAWAGIKPVGDPSLLTHRNLKTVSIDLTTTELVEVNLAEVYLNEVPIFIYFYSEDHKPPRLFAARYRDKLTHTEVGAVSRKKTLASPSIATIPNLQLGSDLSSQDDLTIIVTGQAQEIARLRHENAELQQQIIALKTGSLMRAYEALLLEQRKLNHAFHQALSDLRQTSTLPF